MAQIGCPLVAGAVGFGLAWLACRWVDRPRKRKVQPVQRAARRTKGG